ncbi:MAG: hypothetical protein HYU27_03115 [Acidobacteria bacterium]|nr:hypothetical protein [Acidobacteriota bacterium]
MKTLYRRQRKQYVFGGILGFIGVINLLFFLILYRPARSDYYRLEDSIEKLRVDVQTSRLSADRLERLNARLETSAQDRLRLYTMHFIPRDAGYSEILRQLDAMIQRSGVRNARKDYDIDPAPQHGLYSVRIRIPVAGAYSNIVSLIKGIEDAETFFIVNSIDVRGSELPGVTDVALGLNIETFFYQYMSGANASPTGRSHQ